MIGYRTARILCAEHDETMRDLLMRAIGGQGLGYDVVTSGELDEAKGFASEADLVITNMPKLVQHATRERKPVLYISGLPDDNAAGVATRTLQKPFNVTELETTVTSLIPEHLRPRKDQ